MDILCLICLEMVKISLEKMNRFLLSDIVIICQLSKLRKMCSFFFLIVQNFVVRQWYKVLCIGELKQLMYVISIRCLGFVFIQDFGLFYLIFLKFLGGLNVLVGWRIRDCLRVTIIKFQYVRIIQEFNKIYFLVLIIYRF